MSDYVQKLHYWAERGLYDITELKKAADAMENMQNALLAILNLAHEKLPTPQTSAECTLWAVINGTIDLAEKALHKNGEVNESTID